MRQPNDVIAVEAVVEDAMRSSLISWRGGIGEFTGGWTGHLGMTHADVWSIGYLGGIDNDFRYKLTCTLPGIKKVMRRGTVEECKALAETQLRRFLTLALTEKTDG